MKIALTGATGFIGSAIKKYAEEQGHVVEAMERYALAQSFLTFSVPDVIIHCAAYGNYYDQNEPDSFYTANFGWPHELLKYCKVYGCKFLYFSSSSVLLPTTTMYSATKMGAEYLVKAFVDQYKVQAYIVRPSSVTGPGEQPRHLIPTLIDSCLNGTPMEFVEEPVHDFIDVEDVVRGVFKVLSSGKPGHAYNLSSGASHSNRTVRQMVESATGKTANITKILPSMRSYDSTTWVVPDRDMLNLGFKRNHHLMDSIERMVATQN